MPDNVAFQSQTPATPPAGTTVAAKEIGGVLYQRVALAGIVSTANSTTAVLAADATFTGTGEDVADGAAVVVFVYASHNAAPDGLALQWSADGTTWDEAVRYGVRAGEPRTVRVPARGRYVRVVYTNGPTAQTAFRLQTVIKPVGGDVLDRPGPNSLGVVPEWGSFRRELWDDFERTGGAAGTQSLGVAPSGQVWHLTGAGYAAAQITTDATGQRWFTTTPGNIAYAWAAVSGPVRRVGGTIAFEAGGGTGNATAVFAIGRTFGQILNLIHFQCQVTGWSLDVIDQNGALATITSGAYSVASLSLDTPYAASLTIDGPNAFIELPDGTIRHHTDERFAQYQGPYVFIEPYMPSAATRLPKFGSVYADVAYLPGTVTVRNEVSADATASWTSATAANAAASQRIVGYSTVTVSVVAGGTITGGAVSFEVSDDYGTTWHAVSGVPTTSRIEETSYSVVNGSRAWQFDVGGFTNFRVRLSAVLTGTAPTLTVRLKGTATTASARVVATSKEDWRLNAVAKRFLHTVVLTPGAATAGTNLLGLRKLAANPDVFVHGIRLSIHHAAAAVAFRCGLRRATTVAGGTLVTAANVPKLDTAAANPTLEVRTGAVTGTEAAEYLLVTPSSTTAAPAASTGAGVDYEWAARDMAGRLRLTGDEGLILESVDATDVDARVAVTLEWEEA